ncbi:hypothetical protein CYMTET_23041 [Cymbomonas tetramitiformis]|uniref:Uncharacterized protein n=1 Tax=Cymbomonas tetramitiformis TaxID=36881 RepID=A0AAE0L1C0_9CHLO|nr:hypothetical protein CYMTET_23041 [Cymbomonas tetramitiformis]
MHDADVEEEKGNADDDEDDDDGTVVKAVEDEAVAANEEEEGEAVDDEEASEEEKKEEEEEEEKKEGGGAGDAIAPLNGSLHLGRVALQPVVCDVPPPVQHDVPEAPLYPLSASDPARFQSPFESTFADKIVGQISPAAEASLNACSIVHPLAVSGTELSVIDDVDSDSDCGSDDDVDACEPAVVRRVRPVGAASLPRGLSFASLRITCNHVRGTCISCREDIFR